MILWEYLRKMLSFHFKVVQRQSDDKPPPSPCLSLCEDRNIVLDHACSLHF